MAQQGKIVVKAPAVKAYEIWQYGKFMGTVEARSAAEAHAIARAKWGYNRYAR